MTEDEVVQYVTHPVIREELDAWLRTRNIRMARIPDSEDDLLTYIMSPIRWPK